MVSRKRWKSVLIIEGDKGRKGFMMVIVGDSKYLNLCHIDYLLPTLRSFFKCYYILYGHSSILLTNFFSLRTAPHSSGKSGSSHLAAQGSNLGYATSFCLCGLPSHLCGLFLCVCGLRSQLSGLSCHMCAGSLLGLSPLGWGTKKKKTYSPPALLRQGFHEKTWGIIWINCPRWRRSWKPWQWCLLAWFTAYVDTSMLEHVILFDR